MELVHRSSERCPFYVLISEISVKPILDAVRITEWSVTLA